METTIIKNKTADTRSWRAVYSDQTTLRQYKEDGTEHKYTDIDRSKLLFFDIIDNDDVVCRIHFDDSRKRLIYRRRTALPSGYEPIIVILAGWQMTIKDENIQVINYITSDNKVLMSSGWDEPFGSVVLESYEKEVN